MAKSIIDEWIAQAPRLRRYSGTCQSPLLLLSTTGETGENTVAISTEALAECESPAEISRIFAALISWRLESYTATFAYFDGQRDSLHNECRAMRRLLKVIAAP